jgi:hypothetical protein
MTTCPDKAVHARSIRPRPTALRYLVGTVLSNLPLLGQRFDNLHQT